MSVQLSNEDWIIHPSQTVLSVLDDIGLESGDLGGMLNKPDDWVDRFLKCQIPVDEYLADDLSRVVGGSIEFWTNVQNQYEADLKNISSSKVLGESISAWVKSFEYSDMANKGWLAKTRKLTEQYGNLLCFFDVTDICQWEEKYTYTLNRTKFRKATKVSLSSHAVSAWLAQGERSSRSQITDIFSKKLLMSKLEELRILTLEPDIYKVLSSVQKILNNSGVRFASVPNIKGAPISGAAIKVDDIPTILLSCRYKTNDQFWFSLFHELGHILLHNTDDGFIDLLEAEDGREEREANEFAQEALFPLEQLSALSRELFRLNARAKARKILGAAKHSKIAPGIVVGQLQHAKVIPYSHFNKLKKKFEF